MLTARQLSFSSDWKISPHKWFTIMLCIEPMHSQIVNPMFYLIKAYISTTLRKTSAIHQNPTNAIIGKLQSVHIKHLWQLKSKTKKVTRLIYAINKNFVKINTSVWTQKQKKYLHNGISFTIIFKIPEFCKDRIN